MSLPADYFERMYDAARDPWGFTDRWYEQRKRAVTLAALPQRRYRTGYEPGCSIGVLTAELAERCDALLASDVSATALASAAARLADRPHVRLEQRALPQGWPAERFDLVVLSELLYYLDDADLRDVVRRAIGAVAPGGTLLAVHWLHPVQDYPQTGRQVQAALAAAASPALTRTVQHTEADFDLAVYQRPAAGEGPLAVSVASREGLC